MQANLKMGCGALFKVTAVNEVTGASRELTDWTPNLVTDWGLDNMKNTYTGTAIQYIFDKCALSTSNTTPQYTDVSRSAIIEVTATVSNIGGTHSNGVVLKDATNEHYWFRRDTYIFAANSGITSQNIASISLGFGTAGSWNAVSVALLKDANGNPTTISPQPGEALHIQREWRWYPSFTFTDTPTFNLLDGSAENAVISSHTLKVAADTSSLPLTDPQPNAGIAKPFSYGMRRIGLVNSQPGFEVTAYNNIPAVQTVRDTQYSNFYKTDANVPIDPTESVARRTTVTMQVLSTDGNNNYFTTSGDIEGVYVYATVGAYVFDINPPIPRSAKNFFFKFSIDISRYGI